MVKKLAVSECTGGALMTHDNLCQVAMKFLHRNGFKVVFGDRFQTVNATGEQPDAIGFRHEASCLIEVKVSRSDFLADRHKRFRANPNLGMGDWRFYLSPVNIITVDDLPEGWGLLLVDGKRVCEMYGWPSNGVWSSEKPFIANKQAEWQHMYSALRRLERFGHLDAIHQGYPKKAKHT